MWSYSDFVADLAMFENDFKPVLSAEKTEDNAYLFLLLVLLGYVALLLKYSCKAIEVTKDNSDLNDQRNNNIYSSTQ